MLGKDPSRRPPGNRFEELSPSAAPGPQPRTSRMRDRARQSHPILDFVFSILNCSRNEIRSGMLSRLFPLIQNQQIQNSIAVGTVIADRPPHRPVRAELPHTVLTLDVDMQTSRWDTGEGSSVSVASVCRAWRTLPKSGGGLVGCVAGGCVAT